MTFLEAYTLHGPDVELIAKELGIDPPEADRLINEEMDRRYQAQQVARRPAAIPVSTYVSVPKSKRLIRYAGYDERERR